MNSFYDFDVSIINIADEFFEAYKRCSEGKNPRVNEYGATVLSVVNLPAIVNAAFASELYLKSMLPKKTRIHNLKDLFYKLSSNIQEQLKRQLEPEFNALNWKKDFDGYFDDIDDVFSFWRYIHEKDKPIGFLGNRINECLIVFAILLPKLKQIAEIQSKDKN